MERNRISQDLPGLPVGTKNNKKIYECSNILKIVCNKKHILTNPQNTFPCLEHTFSVSKCCSSYVAVLNPFIMFIYQDHFAFGEETEVT